MYHTADTIVVVLKEEIVLASVAVYHTHPAEEGVLYIQLAEVGCTVAAEAVDLRILPALSANCCTGAAAVAPYTMPESQYMWNVFAAVLGVALGVAVADISQLAQDSAVQARRIGKCRVVHWEYSFAKGGEVVYRIPEEVVEFHTRKEVEWVDIAGRRAHMILRLQVSEPEE